MVHPPITFVGSGDFAAMDAARAALRAAGFSVGSHQRGESSGILFGEVLISKWRNMSREERRVLHGQLWETREGPATVMIHADAPAEAVAAFQLVRAAAERGRNEFSARVAA